MSLSVAFILLLCLLLTLIYYISTTANLSERNRVLGLFAITNSAFKPKRNHPVFITTTSTQSPPSVPTSSFSCGSIQNFDCGANVTCGVLFVWITSFYHAPQKSANVNRKIVLSEQPKLKFMRQFTTARMVRELAPKLPLALITDVTTLTADTGLFSHVIYLDRSALRSTLFCKAAFLSRSPFNRTLLLDMDIEVLKDPTRLFPLLNYYDILAAVDSLTGDPSWVATQQLQPPTEVTYNSGVMLYRTDDCSKQFFELWQTIWKSRFTSCMWRGPWDQCALTHAIRSLPRLKFGTLHYDMNCVKWNQIPLSEVYFIHGFGCGAMVKHEGILYKYAPKRYHLKTPPPDPSITNGSAEVEHK